MVPSNRPDAPLHRAASVEFRGILVHAQCTNTTIRPYNAPRRFLPTGVSRNIEQRIRRAQKAKAVLMSKIILHPRRQASFESHGEEITALRVSRETTCSSRPLILDSGLHERAAYDAAHLEDPRVRTRAGYLHISSTSLCAQEQVFDFKSDVVLHQESAAPLTTGDWETIAKSRLKKVPREMLDITQGVFSCVIAGEEKINGRQLFEAIKLKVGPLTKADSDDCQATRSLKQSILKATGGLVVLGDDNGIQFINSAVKEYITSGKSLYSVSEGDAHQYMSKMSWSYICRANIGEDLNSAVEPRRCIARYFVEHCITHTRRAEARGRSADFITELIRLNPEAFDEWAQKYSKITKTTIQKQELREPLLFAARFGLHSMAKKILGDCKVEEDAQDMACEVAFEHSHRDIGVLILDNTL